MTQPYDRYLKSLAADDPRVLYYLLQTEPPPPNAAIIPIVQELASKRIILDCGFLVEHGGESRVDIFEFKAQYSNSARKQILDYALMMHLDRSLPVRCTMVLVSSDTLPKSYDELPPLEIAGLMSIRFRTVKLWEIDAERVLALDKPNLLSALPLLRTNREQMIEGARRIYQVGTVDARRWFLTFAKIKYDEVGVERFFEEAPMNAAIMEKIFKEIYPLSPLGKREIQEARDQGVQVGLQEGLQEGQLTEARDFVRRLLTRRFPSLAVPESLDLATDVTVLRSLEDALIEATTIQEAQKALTALIPS